MRPFSGSSGSFNDSGLDRAVDEFIHDVHLVLTGMAGDLPAPVAVKLERDVTVEASNLALSVIDADDRHTDVELEAYVSAFGHRFDTQLGFASTDDVRKAGLAVGKKRWLLSASELFDLICAADARNRTAHSWTYYERAMRVAHTVCALDARPSDDELRAVDGFRALLVQTMTGRGVGRPGSKNSSAGNPEGNSQDNRSGFIPGFGPAPPGISTGISAGPIAVAASDATTPVVEQPLPPAEPLEDLLAELDALVGLDGVKSEVRLVTNMLQVQQLRKERNLPLVDASRHLVFTGNPGTGKTTVGRLLARIYRTLGVVDKGHLVESDRASLVAGYVGQTAIKVTEVFDRARGGVLLIDEAYALARGGEKDFGREAIDTLVKLIEDRREDTVVVVAGYPAEMAEFIQTNPGLRSRFPKTIHFEDYSDDQLVVIFSKQCDKAKFVLSDDTKRAVKTWFASQPRTQGFGNGRLARNLFEATVANQAMRLMKDRAKDAPALTDESLLALDPADIPPLPKLETLPEPGTT
jgi:ATPase family associated with various cellular activities (AAA)/AAA lid domain